MNYQGMQPVETVSPAVAAGSATPSKTVLTALSWIKLFSVAITYVTQAATTPVVTISILDAAANILWRKTSAALTAAVTNTISVGNCLSDNTSVSTAQQLGIPADMMVPPGGTVVVSATAANAADTIAAASEYTL